jgi:diphthamide synthase subunit DPH2
MLLCWCIVKLGFAIETVQCELFVYYIFQFSPLHVSPLVHHQKDNLVNMRGNALQWRAIFAGS